MDGDSKGIKLLKTVVIVLFFMLMIIIVLRLGQTIIITSNFGTTQNQNTDNPFQQYNTTMSGGADGSYYLKYSNVNGSATFAEPGESQEYYSMDIVISLPDESLALKLQNNSDYMLVMFRDVMEQFHREDLMNDRGREYLKTLIKRRIALDFNISDVEDIYFEKLVFQTM